LNRPRLGVAEACCLRALVLLALILGWTAAGPATTLPPVNCEGGVGESDRKGRCGDCCDDVLCRWGGGIGVGRFARGVTNGDG